MRRWAATARRSSTATAQGKIFEVALSHVLGLSKRQPVMMQFEDALD
jgi:hypothetical protein